MRDDELGRVFDGDEPFVLRDRRDQRLGERRLAGARRPGNEDIAPGLHRKLQEFPPFAGFLQGEQAMLVGGKLFARRAHVVE